MSVGVWMWVLLALLFTIGVARLVLRLGREEVEFTAQVRETHFGEKP